MDYLELRGYSKRNILLFLSEVSQALLEVQQLAAAAAICTCK